MPGLLHRIEEALQRPVWQIYLGRKAFVPSVPVHISGGFRPDEDLETALRQHPWPRADLDVPPSRWRPEQLRLTLESPSGSDVRMDQPDGASFTTRSFLPRRVENSFLKLGTGDKDVPIRQESGEGRDVPVAPGDQSEEP